MFISGIFIPLNELPTAGQLLAFFSPLTHTLLLIRKGLGGDIGAFPPYVSIVILVLTSFIFFYLSFQFHEINKKRE